MTDTDNTLLIQVERLKNAFENIYNYKPNTAIFNATAQCRQVHRVSAYYGSLAPGAFVANKASPRS